MARSMPPRAFWPLTITAGVNDYIDLSINGGAEVSYRIAAGTYLSIASLLAACQTALLSPAAGPVGAEWISRSSGTTVALYDVALSGTRLLAVGASGVIRSSDDNGVTWTARTSATVDLLHGILLSGARLIAVGFGATGLSTSDDNGATWTARTGGGAGMSLYAACVVGTRVYAVGALSGTGGVAYTSDDNGTTWTMRSAGTSNSLYDVIGAASGRIIAVGNQYRIQTSDDAGVTWTQRMGDVSGAALWGVALYGTRLVAVGTGGAVFVSDDDGASWSSRSSGVTADLRDTIKIGSRIVAVGLSGAVVVSDDNGDTWSAAGSGTSTGLRAIAASGTRAIAVGDSGTVLTSDPVSASPSLTSTITSDASGRVSFAFSTPVSLRFGSGAHAAKSSAALLGYASADTASALTLKGTYQHANGWYPERPVTNDSRPDKERTISGTVALSGITQSLQFGGAREIRSVSFAWLQEWKAKMGLEGTAHPGEALERLWLYGYARFRWWPDATDDATWIDVCLDPTSLGSFTPSREERLQRYAHTLRMRRYA